MKKIYLIIVLVFALNSNVFAQRSDGFFSDYDSNPYNRISNPDDIGLNLPSGSLGSTNSESALPIGSGLLILTALGLGYSIGKRKK